MTTYDKASLVMIPSGYKDDKLYSVKPTDGSGDFTFSRDGAGASPATRVNASGLIEKGRTNLAVSSNDISTQSTLWSANQGGVTTQNSATAPDGSATASTITANGVNTYSGVTQGITMSGLRYTYSVYLKAVSGTPDIRLTCFDGSTFHQQDFTLSTSWERYSITFTPASGSNAIYITSTQAVSWNAWGAQLELGLVPTELIETTTAAVSAGLLGDMPRLDYSGGATCPSLLLEPSRVNLFTQSEYFSSSDWTKQDSTITDNAAISPEGVQNASLYTTTSDIYDFVRQTKAFTSGTAYTLSVFVKAGTSDEIGLTFQSTAFGAAGADFNLTTLAVTEYGTTTGKIEDYGNGWYRCSATATATASVSATTGFSSIESGAVTTLYLYGAQLESGSCPTSYIPCYGSASTRGADNGNKVLPDSILGTDYNEGTLFFELELNQEAITRAVSIVSGFWTTSSVRIECTPSTGLFACDIVNASVGATGTSISVSPLSKGDTIKCALAWNNGTFVFYANGQSTSGSCPVMTTKIYNLYLNRLGTFNGVGNYESNDFKQVLVFPTALTNAELAALTTL